MFVQSTALLTKAWAPFPKSLWNYIPLNNFANNFCSYNYSFWSAYIVDRMVSFWIFIVFLLFSFFFYIWPNCFPKHFLPSILNFYFSNNNFLLFFFSSFFINLPFTHKSFFICIFLVTTAADLAWCCEFKKSWLLGRDDKAKFDWGFIGWFESTEKRFR